MSRNYTTTDESEPLARASSHTKRERMEGSRRNNASEQDTLANLKDNLDEFEGMAEYYASTAQISGIKRSRGTQLNTRLYLGSSMGLL
jgi:hypothetical protein